MRRLIVAIVIYALSATGLVVAWIRRWPPSESAPMTRTASIADTRVIAAEGVVEDLDGGRLRDVMVLLYDASEFEHADREPVADAPTDAEGRFRVYGILRAAKLIAVVAEHWVKTIKPQVFEAGDRELRLVCRAVGGLGVQLTLDGKPFGADDLARAGAGLFAVDASRESHAFRGVKDSAEKLRSPGMRGGRVAIELRNGDRRLVLAGAEVVVGFESFPPWLNPFELGSLAGFGCRELLVAREQDLSSTASPNLARRPSESLGGLAARLTLDGKDFGADDLFRAGATLFAVDARGVRHAFAETDAPAGGLRCPKLGQGRVSIELGKDGRSLILIASTEVVAGMTWLPLALNPCDLGLLHGCREMLGAVDSPRRATERERGK